MKSFDVNKYITLKLENGKTLLYINNELFLQCKFLLLDIPVTLPSSLNEIDSIDKAAEKIYNFESIYKYNIPPETEFWGHCSNMQVWVEHDYDTRLLHSSLAFPLLSKLLEIGAPIATTKFKEEIVKRLETGCKSVINFLYEEGYIYRYLSKEEIFYSLLNPEEAEALIGLGSFLGKSLYQRWEDSEPNTFIIEDRHIKSLNLSHNNLEKVPETLSILKRLEKLYLYHNKIKIFQNQFLNSKILLI